jgi:release factor glutamine methyltransferase
MTKKEADRYLIDALSPKFGNTEANFMLRILKEDYELNGKSLFDEPIDSVTIDIVLTQLLHDYPIQYLVGKAYFYENYFIVDESVLIPRSDTEVLVYEAIKLIKSNNYKSFVDIGTGSGCIPISTKKVLPTVKAIAIDISEKALQIARKNAEELEVDIEFLKFDFLKVDLKNLPLVDIIISNPPYISHDEKNVMSASVLKHEPDIALFPLGDDVLIFYKRLSLYFNNSEAKAIVCELNEFNAQDVKSIFKDITENVKIIKDLDGRDRVLIALK